MILVGVIADTHIPDRARQLHPQILPIFKEAKVNLILHAGDISTPGVLRELEQVAPVQAVKGNRDWVYLNHLPKQLELSFYGVRILITHGHGNLFFYLAGHAHRLMGKDDGVERARIHLLAEYPGRGVLIFGHLHQPINAWYGEQLLFNPGSPHFPSGKERIISVGLLTITEEGKVEGRMFPFLPHPWVEA